MFHEQKYHFNTKKHQARIKDRLIISSYYSLMNELLTPYVSGFVKYRLDNRIVYRPSHCPPPSVLGRSTCGNAIKQNQVIAQNGHMADYILTATCVLK